MQKYNAGIYQKILKNFVFDDIIKRKTGELTLGIRKWIFKDEKNDPVLTEKIARELDCGKLAASVLVSRGIKSAASAKEFLNPCEVWNDPYLLPDLARAVNRIKLAKERREKTAVFGDYDADGVTSSVIMTRVLSDFGLNVTTYLPDRIKDGYGMNKPAIDFMAENGISLIITVDCGISCVEEIAYAKRLGIDTVVTDHHKCPETLPECEAIVNPKRSDSLYPFKDLSGAGVAYKLSAALIGIDAVKPLVEFAAIGTVADVVSLTGENRLIVMDGLEKINSNPSPGIAALLKSASKTGKADSSCLAFIVSPRINCAGRMENPKAAYDLLTAYNIKEAEEKAKRLNELNSLRQATEQNIYREAVEIIKDKNLIEDEVIVVGKKGWHEGVIGIVAARVTEKTNKPCIVISYGDDGIGKGSGRSIEGFDLYEALSASKGSLVKFGGHSGAAGLSLKMSDEEIFRSKINTYASEVLTDEDRIKKIYIDARADLKDITVKNINVLSLFEPTGSGNTLPVFGLINVKILDMRLLSEGKHLKLVLEKDGFTLDAIGFNMGTVSKKLYTGKIIHAAGNIEINDYTKKPQLIIKDILY